MAEFSQELFDTICERIADGESLRSICRDDAMPALSTAFKWLDEKPGLSDQYARACEVRQAHLFDEIIDIADTPVVGEKRKTTKDGVEIVEGDMIEHRRLQIEARKWALGRMNPKKYGDKVEMDHKSSDGSMTPITGFDIRVASAPASDADEAAG